MALSEVLEVAQQIPKTPLVRANTARRHVHSQRCQGFHGDARASSLLTFAFFLQTTWLSSTHLSLPTHIVFRYKGHWSILWHPSIPCFPSWLRRTRGDRHDQYSKNVPSPCPPWFPWKHAWISRAQTSGRFCRFLPAFLHEATENRTLLPAPVADSGRNSQPPLAGDPSVQPHTRWATTAGPMAALCLWRCDVRPTTYLGANSKCSWASCPTSLRPCVVHISFAIIWWNDMKLARARWKSHQMSVHDGLSSLPIGQNSIHQCPNLDDTSISTKSGQSGRQLHFLMTEPTAEFPSWAISNRPGAHVCCLSGVSRCGFWRHKDGQTPFQLVKGSRAPCKRA